jgi:hypothetical protein
MAVRAKHAGEAAGAPRRLDRALVADNHSTSYVRAIRRFAASPGACASTSART